MGDNRYFQEPKYLNRDLKTKIFLIKQINSLNFKKSIIQCKPISEKTLDCIIAKKIACSISSFQHEDHMLHSYLNKINISEKIKSYSRYFQEFLTEKQLEILYQIVVSSKESTSIQIIASNAITILNYLNFNFKDKSLEGIKVPSSDLSGCNFINTSLENSDLSGCNLCNSYFYCSNLENCNLSGAKFGKLKSIKASDNDFDILFSASGKYFASSKKVKIWDTKTSKKIMEMTEWATKAIAFSPCEKYVAIGTTSSEIAIWDIERKSQVDAFKLYCPENLVYSPCGNYLLAFSDAKGHLINLLTKKSEKYSNNYIDFALFSKTGKTIIEVLNSGISLYDTKTLELIEKTITGGSTKCSCLTENFIILGDQNGELYIWNTKLNEKISWKAHIGAAITSISTDSDRGLAATSSFDRSIKLWDLNTQNLIYQYHCGYFSRNIKCVLVSNLSLLAISSDNEILFLDYASLIKAKPYTGAFSLIEYVSASHDNKFITSIGKNQETIVWDIAKNRQEQRYVKKYKFWSNWTYRNRLRKTINYEEIILKTVKSRVTLFTISPCENFFAYNFKGSGIYIFDLVQNQCIQTIDTDPYVSGFLLSNKGQYLITAHKSKGLAILWDIKSGTNLNAIKLSSNWNILVASDCAGYIAVSYHSDINVFNAQNSERIGKLVGISDEVGVILFFSDSWKYLAACGKKDRRILVWDVETKGVVLEINGHLGEITYLSFYLDKNFLISASSDMTLKAWNIDAESEKDTLNWSSMSNEFSAYKTSFKNAVLNKKNKILIDSLSSFYHQKENDIKSGFNG